MITETMTIHEALAVVKVLDSKITDKMNSTSFVAAKKAGVKKVNNVDVAEYVSRANSTYQAIIDLINRRKALKNAISMSNASTKVVIGGVEYTVAEAIEMKREGISNYALLINILSNQMANAERSIVMRNEELERSADAYINSLYGQKEKMTLDMAETAAAARKTYIDMNSLEIVSMDNIYDNIVKLRDKMDAFSSEVDSKLSISNALTTITIEY